MKLLTFITCSILAFATLGCESTPTGQAAEVRSLFKEAQTQVAAAKADPAVNQAKVAELQHTLDLISPGIDALEVAANEAQTNGGQWINFQRLYVEYKPQVESLLIGIVLKRYLGT